MMKFKLNGNIFYTDTDSIFTDKPLDLTLIGKDLGLMKDELGGLVIKEAYFLDIKKYGYWYLDKKGNRIEKSTIAGIPRNSVSFDEVKSLVKGSVLTRDIDNMFYHDFSKLDIHIKKHKVSISFHPSKKLQGNEYLPPKVNTLNNLDKIKRMALSYSKRYLAFFKKYLIDIIEKIKS